MTEQNKVKKEEIEKKAFIIEHNKYISNIDLECMEYKKKATVLDDESEEMDVSEHKYERIETNY